MLAILRESRLSLSAVALISGGLTIAAPASGSAQAKTGPPAVVVAGTGPDTYVLLSGMVGGITGFRQLSNLLADDGSRVITIDAYQLSIDSAEVSFDALARRVDAVLAQYAVLGARVIGHAHGGGVALRLAANYPARVSEVILLDVGAQAVNKGPVFSNSMRLVPLIAKLPFGRRFIRDRYVKGLRENGASPEWLNDSTARAYTDPVLDNIGRVVSMALRLAKAQEPEPLSLMLARVRVPVTLMRGETLRPAGPGTEELAALQQLGSLFRTDTIAAAGHFPHEEAANDVARRVRRQALLVNEKRIGR